MVCWVPEVVRWSGEVEAYLVTALSACRVQARGVCVCGGGGGGGVCTIVLRHFSAAAWKDCVCHGVLVTSF